MRADHAGEPGVMFGHFSTFGDFYEVDSWLEGRFVEQVARGAFEITFREDRDQIKSLFQHGRDPVVGAKPLGVITDLREDAIGAAYEVELIETDYVRDSLLAGLEAGLYGASFRFQVLREEWRAEPPASAKNPEGLPERTITEARVFEFGPVTFPANPAATSGVRAIERSISLTDWYYAEAA